MHEVVRALEAVPNAQAARPTWRLGRRLLAGVAALTVTSAGLLAATASRPAIAAVGRMDGARASLALAGDAAKTVAPTIAIEAEPAHAPTPNVAPLPSSAESAEPARSAAPTTATAAPVGYRQTARVARGTRSGVVDPFGGR